MKMDILQKNLINLEKAGLSVGLMYGNGGGHAASTAGGDGMQPSGPKMNPVEAALQQQAMGYN